MIKDGKFRWGGLKRGNFCWGWMIGIPFFVCLFDCVQFAFFFSLSSAFVVYFRRVEMRIRNMQTKDTLEKKTAWSTEQTYQCKSWRGGDAKYQNWAPKKESKSHITWPALYLPSLCLFYCYLLQVLMIERFGQSWGAKLRGSAKGENTVKLDTCL